MKKTLLLAVALLPGVLLAQNNNFNMRGKDREKGCLGSTRGCVPNPTNSITFSFDKNTDSSIVLSIPVKNLSEAEQVYLIGTTVTNIKEEVFLIQEENYYFSEEEKEILELTGNAYLKKDRYPVRIDEERLFIELTVSQE